MRYVCRSWVSSGGGMRLWKVKMGKGCRRWVAGLVSKCVFGRTKSSVACYRTLWDLVMFRCRMCLSICLKGIYTCCIAARNRFSNNAGSDSSASANTIFGNAWITWRCPIPGDRKRDWYGRKNRIPRIRRHLIINPYECRLTQWQAMVDSGLSPRGTPHSRRVLPGTPN